MRPKLTTSALLSDEERDRLRRLLEAVPPDATEDDRAFIGLLEAWRAADVPYPASVIPAYKTRSGWLTAGVPGVCAAIRRRLER